MATYGRISEYDESQCWIQYEERLKCYFEANDITDGSKQRAILLSVCGATCYTLIRNLVYPQKPVEKTFEELCQAMRTHASPKPSEIVQRFKFNSRVRTSGESITTYMAALRQLAEHCNFGDHLEEMLRDRLVCGINDVKIQRRLLAEVNLTYKSAMDISVGMEVASRNAQELQHSRDMPTANQEVNRLQAEGVQHDRKAGVQECYRCGGTHEASKCKFQDAECHKCKKRGHIARKCQSKVTVKAVPSSRRRMNQRSYMSQSTAHFVNEEEREELQDSEPVYSLFKLQKDRSEKAYRMTMSVNGVQCEMEIDTGAGVTVLNETTFESVKKGVTCLVMEPSTIALRTYTGEVIPVLGQVTTEVEYDNKKHRLVAHVVAGKAPNLLGRDWLHHIKLNWPQLWQVNSVGEYSKLHEMLQEYSEVFKKELGAMKGITAKIYIDPSAKPKYCKARPVPYALRPKIEQELERLVAEGTIEPVQFAEWATPIVPIVKSSGQVRICGDYKATVNQASRLDNYPIPKTEDLVATIGGGEKFSKLDMSQAYQQLLLDEESRKYLVINTHKGLFAYNRLPYGVSSAPGIFQRVMENLLQGIPYTVVRVDDVLVSGRNDAEHLQNLKEIFRRLAEANLRLNKEKCTFMASEVTYCGLTIDKDGARTVPEKVQAVVEAPVPQTVTQLKSYLGMLNFYHRYLPAISNVLAPLHRLLKSGATWIWGPQQQKAFMLSKELLVKSPVLVHFDSNKEIILACDASPYGLGAVISHRMEDGSERPIAFASRSMSEAEKRYSQLDKEGLALIFGVKKFHQYLYGTHFTLYTDHQPLVGLFAEEKPISVMASARVQRWALTLAAYEYTIKYRAGKCNANADALSRLPVEEAPKLTPVPAEVIGLMEKMDSTPVNAQKIKNWTLRDPVLSEAVTSTMCGWPERNPREELFPYWSRRLELAAEDGCLLWGNRVVVPPQGRDDILRELHEAHPGVVRMKLLARSYVWWPSINQDIENKVRQCQQCQLNQKTPSSVTMHPWEYPKRPWSRVHIDYAGPFLGKMFLVVVDAYSKWIDVHPTDVSTSEATIEKLRVTFANQGLPEVLVSDNAACFTSDVFQGFLNKNGVKHLTSPAYHPASNGLAERAVQTFKDGMKKLQGGSISTRVSRFLFAYRTTPQTVTGQSPAELLNNRKYRTALDAVRPNWVEKLKQREFVRQQGQMKKPRSVHPGSSVYIKNFSGCGPQWLSGTVVTASDSIAIIEVNGKQIRRHLDHVRIRPEFDDSEDTTSLSYDNSGTKEQEELVDVGREAQRDSSEALLAPGETTDMQAGADTQDGEDVQAGADIRDKPLEESFAMLPRSGPTTTQQAVSTTSTTTSTDAPVRLDPEVRRSRRVAQGRPPTRFKDYIC